MNIRFDSKVIRIRVKLAELNKLSEDGRLDGVFPLSGDDRMEWNLRLSEQEEPSFLRSDAVFYLSMPRHRIHALRERAGLSPGKKELQVSFENAGVPIVLDVDFFDIAKRGTQNG